MATMKSFDWKGKLDLELQIRNEHCDFLSKKARELDKLVPKIPKFYFSNIVFKNLNIKKK
jgi:hypothetical protein